jgi:hypothetical protein
LLTFSPFAVSLPVHRIGSQLNLLCDSLWVFEYVAAQGMYEILLTEKSPLMELENKRMFSLGEVSSFTSRKYYMASINAVNKLMIYCNNPVNFTNNAGEYEYKKHIQFYVAINLLFEDLNSISISNHNYIKIRFAFNFLDKLSNLVFYYVGRPYESETEVFKYILSKKFGEKLARMLRKQYGSDYEELGTLMYSFVNRTYEQIYKKSPDIARNFSRKPSRPARFSFLSAAYASLLHFLYKT